MQHAKDSFLLALRDRLAALAPERTILVDGVARPAVLCDENEAPSSAPPAANAFHLAWGICATPLVATDLRRLACHISYRTSGDANARGRDLAQLDFELAHICAPPRITKYDHTQNPARPLGSVVFWTEPQFDAPEDAGGDLLRHARLAVFFTPEVAP